MTHPYRVLREQGGCETPPGTFSPFTPAGFSSGRLRDVKDV